MKKATLLFLLMLGVKASSFSQTVSIINTDTSVCAGQPLLLHASHSNLPPLTNNYSVNQISYHADTFVGSHQVTLTDDDQTLPINLPFKFCFFGISYNQVIIASNGWVGFSLGQPNSWAGSSIPNGTGVIPRNCIMLPYQDLNPQFGGSITYDVYGIAPNRRFVISYNNVPYFFDPLNPSSSCLYTFTGQVKLFEANNIIETHIKNKPICGWNNGTGTHALHDLQGLNSILVNNRNYNTWSTSNEGYAFVPSGGSSGVISWFCGNAQIGSGNTITINPTQNCSIYAVINYGCGTTGEDTSQFLNISVSNLKFGIPDFQVTPVSCYGQNSGTLKANPTGGIGSIDYLWNTASTNQTITNLKGGNYSCTIKDASGCTIQKSYNLTEPQKLNAEIEEISFPKCFYSSDGQITVKASGGTLPFLFQWSNGTYSRTIKNVTNGFYTLIVTDAHQCQDSLSLSMFTPEVKISAGPDRTINPNEATILHAEVSPQGSYSYYWSPNYQLNYNNTPYVNALPHKPTVYTLSVTSNTGCIYKDSVFVNVKFDENLVIYNAFSPNNDGQNDIFTLKKYTDLFILDRLNIFNRWGKEVYTTTDINQGWDGSYNGQPQEIGTYIYEATIKSYDGKPHILKGNISLLR